MLDFLRGRGVEKCVMVCMYVNDKGLYCVVNVVMDRIEELNWSSGTGGSGMKKGNCV